MNRPTHKQKVKHNIKDNASSMWDEWKSRTKCRHWSLHIKVSPYFHAKVKRVSQYYMHIALDPFSNGILRKIWICCIIFATNFGYVAVYVKHSISKHTLSAFWKSNYYLKVIKTTKDIKIIVLRKHLMMTTNFISNP